MTVLLVSSWLIPLDVVLVGGDKRISIPTNQVAHFLL
jgi:hypothetical protein